MFVCVCVCVCVCVFHWLTHFLAHTLSLQTGQSKRDPLTTEQERLFHLEPRRSLTRVSPQARPGAGSADTREAPHPGLKSARDHVPPLALQGSLTGVEPPDMEPLKRRLLAHAARFRALEAVSDQ